MKRSAAALVIALLGSLAGIVPAGSPASATVLPDRIAPVSVSSCVAAGSVFVIVVGNDGSTVASGCVSNPGSGSVALRAVASVKERSDEPFVCQINGVPDACIQGSAWSGQPYWQYHHAKPGGSWTYSAQGYTFRTPPAGSIEGWCLSAGPNCLSKLKDALNPGGVPPFDPAPKTTNKPTSTAPVATSRATTAAPRTTATGTTAPRATAPRATATTKATATARTTRPVTTTPPSVPASTTQSTSTTTTRSTSPSARPSTSASPSASPSGSASTLTTATQSPLETSASPMVTEAQPPPGDTGTPWGAIGTAGLIAAAAGAFALVRRRGTETLDA